MNVSAFRRRFAALSGGDSFVYFAGDLSSSQAFSNGRPNLSVKLLRREARRLYEAGEALLAQRRIADGGATSFEYIIWRCAALDDQSGSCPSRREGEVSPDHYAEDEADEPRGRAIIGKQ